jgi:predicted nucleic acid-binding protein
VRPVFADTLYWGAVLHPHDLYERRNDKGYSLVDCISMTTMRRHGILEILTNGRHFMQEGFRAVLR